MQPQLTLKLSTLAILDQVALAEVHEALFEAEHCSILTCDHLTELWKTSFSDNKIARSMKLHCTKCSALLKYYDLFI